MSRFETTAKAALVNQVSDYYSVKAFENNGYSSEDGSVLSPVEKQIGSTMQQMFAGRDVLEIACGTGLWTRTVAQTARCVLATDVNPLMISTAMKKLPPDVVNVQFQVADAYSLAELSPGFTGAFSVLFWCFIPKLYRKSFLTCLHSKLKPSAKVFILCQLEDSDAALHRQNEDGDVIATRVAGGRYFQIPKNIPTEAELTELLDGIACDVLYTRYSNGMWSVAYTVPSCEKGTENA